MNYKDLRDHAAVLGRFASVRDKAQEPSDRIVIQCYDGQLAFIAGVDYTVDASASLKVMAGEESTNGMAVIAARPFLQAAKSLKGKGEVHIEIDKDGCTLRTTVGGEIRLPNVARKVPSLLRVNDGQVGWASFDRDFFGRAAKILTTTTADAVKRGYWDRIELYNEADDLLLQGGTQFMHTIFRLNTGLDWPAFRGAFHPDFLVGIKDFADGVLTWTKDQLRIESGPYLAITSFMPRFPALPELPKHGTPDVKIKIERKGLIEALKTIGGEKIEMSSTNSGGITLAEWPDRKARLNMAAEVKGHSRMATMTKMLADLAAALGGDQLEIEWESNATGPLFLTGTDGWATLGRIPLHT